jgi:Notch-like protein
MYHWWPIDSAATAAAPAAPAAASPLPGQIPDFSCNCTKGWAGLTCTDRASQQQQQQDACQPKNPCLNGGSCQLQPDQPPGYICNCVDNFEGLNCEVDIIQADAAGSAAIDAAIDEQDHIAGLKGDALASPAPSPAVPAIARDGPSTCDTESPCGAGECNPAPGEEPDYTCSCPPGYSGKVCQTKDLNTCDMSPEICQNGGECVPVDLPPDDFETPDYTCKCAGNYTGVHCEVAANTAAAAAGGSNATAVPGAAASGSTAASTVTAVTATANGGAAATAVTGSRTTCANGNPCRNGGSCIPRPGGVPDYT